MNADSVDWGDETQKLKWRYMSRKRRVDSIDWGVRKVEIEVYVRKMERR